MQTNTAAITVPVRICNRVSEVLTMPRFATAGRFHETLALGLSLVMAIVIARLSLMPASEIPGPPGYDKHGHFVAYFLLVLPVVLLARRHLKWLVPMAILYSGFIELLQPFWGRSGEWPDFAANIAGCIVAWAIGLISRRFFNPKHQFR